MILSMDLSMDFPMTSQRAKITSVNAQMTAAETKNAPFQRVPVLLGSYAPKSSVDR